MGARKLWKRMPREVEYRFWGQIRLGLTIEASAAVVGVSATLGRMWFRQRGGVMVAKAADPGSRYLTCAEREEIALQRMGGRRRAGDRPAPGPRSGHD